MINHKRTTVFGKGYMLSNGSDGGCCTIFVKDLRERDTLKGIEDEQRVIVIDASDDDRVSGKTAEYAWKDNQWILISAQGKDGDDGTSLVIIDNEKQLDLLEPVEGDKVYIRDTEKEYLYIDGEWKPLGSNGGSGEVHAKDITTDNALQFISREQKKTISDNRDAIGAIKDFLESAEIDSIGKVKIDDADGLGYLEEKIGETITVKNNLLEVIKLLGQIVTVDDINQLDGIRDNVQDQIDALSRIGNFTGSVDNKTELQAIQDAGLNDMVIVLEDEDHDGESTIYMHNGTDWEYVGKFNIKLDDIEAENVKIKDTANKFPVSKNVEAALAYLADQFDDVKLSIDDLEECCEANGGSGEGSGAGESDGGGVLQVARRRDLPEEGDIHHAYIVDEDETNNRATSLYVWQVDPKTQKGVYVLLITATVGGKMQEYQQVTKLGVVAPRNFEMPIPRTQNFLRAPVEVLKFQKGQNDVKVDTTYSNHSDDDFEKNNAYAFEEGGFTLADTVRIEPSEKIKCGDKNVFTFQLDDSFEIERIRG